MTTHHIGRLRLALLPAAALLLVACAATPTTTPALDQARALYAQAASDPNAARSAPLELRRAQEALTRAETALKAGDDLTAVEHYAYLARQRASTALQAADIARSEQAVAAAGSQRDSILMDARSRQAEKSAMEAQTARNSAEQARLQSEQARKQAEQDRAVAEKARQDALKASADADQARKAAEMQLAAAQAAQAKTAKLQAQLAELQAKQTDRGMVLTLGDVLFDTGRAELKDGALRTVDQLVAFLKENPERTLAIEGYTDSVGSEAFNQSLSLRRAEAVKTSLTQRGVDASRVSAQGLGEASPVGSNTTAEGRQRNRRVEIVISHTK